MDLNFLIRLLKNGLILIKTETLAESIQSETLDEPDFIKSWDIEDEECEISIQRTINN